MGKIKKGKTIFFFGYYSTTSHVARRLIGVHNKKKMKNNDITISFNMHSVLEAYRCANTKKK